VSPDGDARLTSRNGTSSGSAVPEVVPAVVDQICFLGGLGAGARVNGEYADARVHLRSALALVDAHLASTDATPPTTLTHLTVDLLNELGIVGKFAGWFDEAGAAYVRAMAMEWGSGAPRPAKVASLRHNLAGLAHARGRFAEAEQFARSGLSMREALIPADPVGMACDEIALAGILVSLGSAESLEEALHLTDTARPADAGVAGGHMPSRLLTDSLGPDHPEVLVAMSIRAAALHRRGHPDDLVEAEHLYRLVIVAKERVLGAHHPDLVPTLVNHATLLVDHPIANAQVAEARVSEAQNQYRRAQAILADAGLPDHPTNHHIGAALAVLDGIRPEFGRNPTQNPANGNPANGNAE